MEVKNKMKKIFCDRLREARGARSQGKCAESLGISQVSLSQWERGTREPNLDALERIAKFFGVSSDWLLGLSDSRGGAVSLTATDHSVAANNSSVSQSAETARLLSIIESQQRVIERLAGGSRP